MTDKRYDIIFMDHMMPEMDGIETTRVIRRLLGNNGQVPIVALTANAVEGTAEMFISEGMNDMVAKPIEMRVIVPKLQKWLPPEKIEKLRKKGQGPRPVHKEGAAQMAMNISIDGLDVQKAMGFLGNEELFWSVLKEYYRVIDKKCALIQEYEQKEMWREYTVEVHGSGTYGGADGSGGQCGECCANPQDYTRHVRGVYVLQGDSRTILYESHGGTELQGGGSE